MSFTLTDFANQQVVRAEESSASSAGPTAGVGGLPEVAPQSDSSAQATRGRSVYLDSLRAFALVRVFVFHLFNWVWLPLLFPSMGVMFALAGSLMAASLDKQKGKPWLVVRKRLRRLLPPLWFMGFILVPVMVLAGWTVQEYGTDLTWRSALLWVFPIANPPGSDLGSDWVLTLWYIRTYLWFVLLAPASLWLFRRWPKRMLLLVAAPVVFNALGTLDLSDASGETLLSLSMFAACWFVGYARHDGTLQRINLRLLLPIAGALLSAGLVTATVFHGEEQAWAVDDIPLATAFYCLGATLLLLRINPTMAWLQRGYWLSGLVAVLNARAVTLYLWGNVAIWAAPPLLDSNDVTSGWFVDGWVGWLVFGPTALVLWLACVPAFGWVEDLAAGRPIRMNPWPRPGIDRRRSRDAGGAPQPTTPQHKSRRWLTCLASADAGSPCSTSGCGFAAMPVPEFRNGEAFEPLPVAVERYRMDDSPPMLDADEFAELQRLRREVVQMQMGQEFLEEQRSFAPVG